MGALGTGAGTQAQGADQVTLVAIFAAVIVIDIFVLVVIGVSLGGWKL